MNRENEIATSICSLVEVQLRKAGTDRLANEIWELAKGGPVGRASREAQTIFRACLVMSTGIAKVIEVERRTS